VTQSFVKVGLFGAALKALVGRKLALLNHVCFASPNCRFNCGAALHQASRRDLDFCPTHIFEKGGILGLGIQCLSNPS